MTYRRVPKVTTLVTFGFRTPPPAITSFGGPLFSGGRYFRMAKTRTPHRHFKRQKSKKCERNTFWKKEMYILYFKTFFQKVFIKRVMNWTVKYNKPRINMAFNLFRIWDLCFRIYQKFITWSSLVFFLHHKPRRFVHWIHCCTLCDYAVKWAD